MAIVFNKNRIAHFNIDYNTSYSPSVALIDNDLKLVGLKPCYVCDMGIFDANHPYIYIVLKKNENRDF